MNGLGGFVGWVDGHARESNEVGDVLFCMPIGYEKKAIFGFLWSVTFGLFRFVVCAEMSFSGGMGVYTTFFAGGLLYWVYGKEGGDLEGDFI